MIFPLILLLLIENVIGLSNLHNFMSEDELHHYFNTKDDLGVTEYEVVQMDHRAEPLKKRSEGMNQELKDVSKSLRFTAFQGLYHLNLVQNQHLLTPTTTIVKYSNNTYEPFGSQKSFCHYTHVEDTSVAGISICGKDEEVTGLVFTESHVLEIHPLTDNLHQKVQDFYGTSNKFSLVKRHHMKDAHTSLRERFNFKPTKVTKRGHGGGFHKFIETGVYVDQAAYKKYKKFFRSENKMQDFILAYMNGVNALYHLPSLQGAIFSLSIIRLEFWQTTPKGFTTSADRDYLYGQFCEFQSKNTPTDDTDPRHYDIGLYISAMDFYDPNNRDEDRKYITMGLSYVDGICVPEYSCVIAELGATERRSDRKYPSTGFGSVMVLGHEMCHNLGVSHDAGSGRCSTKKFIMSPSRGPKGKTKWSPCSAEVLLSGFTPCLDDKPPSSLKHKIDDEIPPGLRWNPTRQCQIFYNSDEALAADVADNKEEICYTLKCYSDPNDYTPIKSSPALEGTPCGNNKWCNEGECTSNPSFKTVSEDGGKPYWTPWSEGVCRSGCFKGSQGYKVQHRACLKDTKEGPVRTDGCPIGKRRRTTFCDASSYCKGKTKSIDSFAKSKCYEFTSLTDMIKPNGKVTRVPYKKTAAWKACAIYCEKAKGNGFYTPVIDVSENPTVDPYYPDGTYCHSKSGINYYCINNECRPENDKSARSSSNSMKVDNNVAGKTYSASFLCQFQAGEDGQPCPNAGPEDSDLEDDESRIDNDEKPLPGKKPKI